MYEYIKGQLINIKPSYIVVDNQGFGWRILCPNPYYWQNNLGQEITVYLELVVREDSQIIYGFKSQQDRDLFLTLMKVSGIGPKSAMSIMAIDDNTGLMQAIEQGDSTYLTKFPGVGKKTAQQMILDLSGKLASFEEENLSQAHQNQIDFKEEVSQALLALGYSAREVARIDKLLDKNQFETTQAALSYAFKQLI